ncbi:cation:proton antiporter [Fulvivirga sp. 29W222]|uniref:Cation:proton antiporter n=1 Tax=Fulvivirga marina TaxID=2494733 RepID=A0A937KCL3_9BACT|nr:cation:proton antiporter [Fulvivirga marina]MBL6448261.1 cation:proton antiporter [Fulvivirga marina]
MNILLTIGLLLITGYTAGWLLDKIGLPKVIGYIATGIVLSPNTIDFVNFHTIEVTHPLMEVCLGFIAFEVGGSLKWSKIKAHEKEILSITLLASLFPFLLISTGVFCFGLLFPTILPIDSSTLLLLASLLGALASPTAPAATLAVIHQYKAKGKVTDTILGVVALDDALGILLFSLTTAIIFMGETGLFGDSIVNSFYEVTVAIFIGTVLGFIIDPTTKLFQITGEGQWVVIIFALIILCVGISKALQVDALLSSMTMGITVVNKCNQQKIIFRILERYTEDLIFLFFFLLSGLHLNISTIPEATGLIFLFVLLRTIGKFIGTIAGARLVKADHLIQKYTAGGLLPQAGIVIGLVLSIYQKEQFKDISEILLTTIMGTTIIYEFIGPISVKYSLMKAGEIKKNRYNKS